MVSVSVGARRYVAWLDDALDFVETLDLSSCFEDALDSHDVTVERTPPPPPPSASSRSRDLVEVGVPELLRSLGSDRFVSGGLGGRSLLLRRLEDDFLSSTDLDRLSLSLPASPLPKSVASGVGGSLLRRVLDTAGDCCCERSSLLSSATLSLLCALLNPGYGRGARVRAISGTTSALSSDLSTPSDRFCLSRDRDLDLDLSRSFSLCRSLSLDLSRSLSLDLSRSLSLSRSRSLGRRLR